MVLSISIRWELDKKCRMLTRLRSLRTKQDQATPSVSCATVNMSFTCVLQASAVKRRNLNGEQMSTFCQCSTNFALQLVQVTDFRSSQITERFFGRPRRIHSHPLELVPKHSDVRARGDVKLAKLLWIGLSLQVWGF